MDVNRRFYVLSDDVIDQTWSEMLTLLQFPDTTRSTYTYAGDGLRRSAFEAGGALTTFIWDGTDYLGEY